MSPPNNSSKVLVHPPLYILTEVTTDEVAGLLDLDDSDDKFGSLQLVHVGDYFKATYSDNSLGAILNKYQKNSDDRLRDLDQPRVGVFHNTAPWQSIATSMVNPFSWSNVLPTLFSGRWTSLVMRQWRSIPLQAFSNNLVYIMGSPGLDYPQPLPLEVFIDQYIDDSISVDGLIPFKRLKGGHRSIGVESKLFAYGSNGTIINYR
jgi:hypothetical protein